MVKWPVPPLLGAHLLLSVYDGRVEWRPPPDVLGIDQQRLATQAPQQRHDAHLPVLGRVVQAVLALCTDAHVDRDRRSEGRRKLQGLGWTMGWSV